MNNALQQCCHYLSSCKRRCFINKSVAPFVKGGDRVERGGGFSHIKISPRYAKLPFSKGVIPQFMQQRLAREEAK